MAQDTVNLIDPITTKFDDNEAMQRVVQQAVTEAVEKARKLGFLQPTASQNAQTNG